jgi:small subunit ribosomal protein S15
MAKLRRKTRGESGPKRPCLEKQPEWVDLTPERVEETIVRYVKEGKSSAEIGIILRDQYGVPSVKLATGKKVGDIIEKNGVAPKYSEDLFNLMKKATGLREHLSKNKKDIHNQRNLLLVEAKIKKLEKYYKKKGVLPKDWEYTPERAKLIVG